MDLGIAAEPEDASGSLDDMESGETGFGDTALMPEGWRMSLEEDHSMEETWGDGHQDQP